MSQITGHAHNLPQVSWFTFVVAELNTRPASLLDLDHAFAVSASQKAHVSRHGYTPEPCSYCISHIKTWRETMMEQGIHRMRNLSSFL